MYEILRTSRKKISKAAKVYEIYCKVNSLAKTREATGLGINTIRRYIAITEELSDRCKISTKDRYYNSKSKTEIERETPPPSDSADYNKQTNVCQVDNGKNINKDKETEIETASDVATDISRETDREILLETETEGETEREEGEVYTANNQLDIRDIKNKLIVNKLDRLSAKYLDMLDNPTDQQIRKTSLKDLGVIAGILLDKKILIEHKQSDAVKNQSIIFNLFGDNKNLAQFISGALNRQQALQDRPVKRYIPAVNK
jgi:hypothetical protein